MAGGIGRNLGKLLITMVTVFVFYLDGEATSRRAGASLGAYSAIASTRILQPWRQ
jgi:hypothetical protein